MFDFFKHFTSKTKILLIGFVLILIPVGIISYMSLRSVNQKAENLEIKYSGTVRLVRDKLENEILRIENSLRNNVIESNPVFEKETKITRWIREIESLNPAFQNLFLIKNQSGVFSSLIWFGGEQSREANLLKEPGKNTDFTRAEKAELVHKNLPDAINFYKKALIKTTSGQERALYISRIGRCYFKSGNFEKGINEYKKIPEIKNETTIGNVPARVVALSQIAFGLKKQNSETERINSCLQLYWYLIENPWDISGGEYQFYLNSASAEMQDLKTSNPVVDSISVQFMSLENQKNKRIEQIEFINLIQKNVSEINSGFNQNKSTENQLHKTFLDKNDNPISIGFFELPVAFQQTGLQVFGYQFCEDYVLSVLIPQTLESVELGKDVLFGILDKNDSLLFIQHQHSVANYLVTGNFDILPGNWKVALFDKEGQTIEKLVGKEKNLYRTLFAGIIFVMLIGIVVIVRAVIHESEMARMKSEFVSNVSHELKTPLALIRMFGETLDSGIVNDEKKRKEFYGIIRKESERLTHLINNVLDFSKMDSGRKKYYFEEADLVQVVKSSLEAYKFHIRDNGFEIENELPDEPLFLSIDKDSISQAILNLLSNAVKYSEEKKFIKVKVQKDSGSALISVSDKGIGIPKDEIKKIFDKFYRVPADKVTETRGSGLGLTLTKQIIEANGGTIEVESEVGKGSNFIIRIPLK
ncbi:cell wall metabolism sensor histidine kinase WalK [Draconibacterium sp.]|nr:cell wall metabolism sensor histidine kinase WalK [Draconibacterium sp.]